VSLGTADNLQPFADEEVLEAARTLGAASGMAASVPAILRTLRDSEFHGDRLASFILGEPVLVARVLRVANSAYYHQARRVASIERAIAVLGIDSVRAIATVAALDMLIDASCGRSALDFAAFRRHSIAAAVIARNLANVHDPQMAVDAFIAALLHDLGQVVQARLRPKGFAGLKRALGGAARPMTVAEIREIELRHVGATHEHCAELVFRDWNLPEALGVAVLFHHAPMAAPAAFRSLAALTHLGDAVHREDAEEGVRDFFGQESSALAQRWLGLTAEQLEKAAGAARGHGASWTADHG
jgi:HD-like signal output (HDOD) protein